MAISIRSTERFGLQHPIVRFAQRRQPELNSHPRPFQELEAWACWAGGYAERAWFEVEAAKVTRAYLGCGFITWAVARDPDLFRRSAGAVSAGDDVGLRRSGAFGSARQGCGRPIDLSGPYVGPGPACGRCRGRRRGRPRNGGGRAWHGGPVRDDTVRHTVVDAVSRQAPTSWCGGGGAADGRGLAAALMLGADGVLMEPLLGNAGSNHPLRGKDGCRGVRR